MFKDYYLLDCKNTDSQVKVILQQKFNYVIEKFNNIFFDNITGEYVRNDYNKIYILNNKYVVYIGVMQKIETFFDKKKYKTVINPQYINDRYTIMIEDMVYDNDFDIDESSFIGICNAYFESDFVISSQVNQYLLRKFEGERSMMFDNYDNFHSISQLFKNKIDLYKMLCQNQEYQTISDNYDINDLVKYYNDVFKLVEEKIKEFNFKIFSINQYEKVLLIEDSLVLYIGAKGKNALFREKEKRNGNVVDRYSIVIQELTFNEIFDKKKFKKFLNEIHILNGSYVGAENYNNINYRPFSIGNPDEKILKGYHPRFYNNSNFDYVNNKILELKLKERYDNWKGQLRYFIVYEFIYYKDKIGYAVASTLDPNPRMVGRNMIHQYESHAGYLMYFPSIFYDHSWGELITKFVEEQKNSHWNGYKRIGEKSSLFAEKVQYFIVPYYVNNINIHQDIVSQIIADAKLGKYKNFERTLYDISEYKWKSEELMYQCVKKIFKNKKVIHQYNPFFLGKQTYDVFVCGKNIAFEYQGKQHFEPVEIFGGEENFIKQQERDKLKKELSEKNNVELIYVNYWEDITTDLIKQKLKDKNIKI